MTSSFRRRASGLRCEERKAKGEERRAMSPFDRTREPTFAGGSLSVFSRRGRGRAGA